MDLGKIAFIVMVILQTLIRYPYRGKPRSGVDRQEQFVLLLITIGMMILPLIYIFTDWLAVANYEVPLWVKIIGIVIMAMGLWLFWRSHTDLGSNWSPTLEIYEEHQLVTRGVYQVIRHPMYAASWLMMIAQILLLSNWIAGFSGIISFGVMYFIRVSREEAMMLKEFGDQYKDYMAHTGRVIPKRG